MVIAFEENSFFGTGTLLLPSEDSKASLVFCIVCHLCPGLHAAAKIAIFHVLRTIASLTIFRSSCDFSQFFVMLITEVQSELSI